LILQWHTYFSVMFDGRSCRFCAVAVLLLAMSGIALGGGAMSEEPSGQHQVSEHPAAQAGSAGEHTAHGQLVEIEDEVDPHAHHRQMMARKDYSRSVYTYALPDLPLVTADGGKTSLLDEVNTAEPVMLNFIFTTCTTICPVLSASFSQVQQQLGAERDQVRMVSITIDPEYDTPERLRAYAARYHAGQQWQFLTGNLDDIVSIQKAFGAFRGTKVNHEPFIFLRATPASPWVRLDGLANAADIIKEYRQLVAEQAAIR
jgi:protein SCO1/2